ncbi:MAG: PD-(D/E)XK nuclease family protein, partial [Kiritimatiellaceae bacterium]|nr:PD-(D/E)XK nuclease family protein [Kiritimatiellaceae bacterium]
PKELQNLPELTKSISPKQFTEHAIAIIEHHALQLPDEVTALIEQIGDINLPPATPNQLLDLFEEQLNNLTLKDHTSTENGVWIINPMDAAGLRFKSVFLGGMDDRTFPQIPKADSLLNHTERQSLRAFLNEREIPCPRLALSETGEALTQEEILFLTAVSTAEEQLTLSFAHAGSDGKERTPGEFFERIRGLVDNVIPAHGESFHTILPPSALRAEDEARQTEAWLTPPPPKPQYSPTPLPALQTWLKNNPELSATALESLARNRFIFFLEKVLGIKPDRTHNDDIDPMDRGTLIHDILEQVYTTIAAQSGWYAKKVANHWKLAQDGEIPLAVFDPAKADDLIALAHDIANEEFTKAERRPSRHLGHRTVWETEKQKLLQIIENFIQMDLNTALAENRYPALFEMKFDEKHDLPVTLERGDQTVRLKGKIDRIDLIFDTDNTLKNLLVIDYKSKSRNDTIETLEKKIGHNLDCQLALYTFAAQQFFFGNHNTPELNEKTQAVYHLQAREPKTMTNHFKGKRLTMTPELTDSFLETLFSNVWKFANGDLSVEPLIAGYEDYAHICRTQSIDLCELPD